METIRYALVCNDVTLWCGDDEEKAYDMLERWTARLSAQVPHGVASNPISLVSIDCTPWWS